MNAEVILNALSSMRVPAQPEEYEIHARIERALTDCGIEYIHEFRLSRGRRIDFLCGDVGIEVKKGRPAAAALRAQAEKYLSDERLRVLILVMQRPCRIPDTLCGKNVYAVFLDRLWGIALP